MQQIKDLFGNYRAPVKAKRRTERGDCLLWLAEKTGLNIKRIAWLTTGLVVRDLYYLRSDMEQAHKRGIPYGAAFWHAIRPKDGTEEHLRDFHRSIDKDD